MKKEFHIDCNRIQEGAGKLQKIEMYISPNEDEKRYLVDTLKIDEHTLNSSLDPNELGRLEFEPDHAAMIIKRPKRFTAEDNFLFKVESIGLFMFTETLIVVLSEDVPIFDGRQFTRICTIQDLILRIIFRSINHFEEHIKVISMISDELEQQINKSISNRQLLNMFTLEKSLVFYLDGIGSNRMVIGKLKSSAAKIALSAANIEYLDDLAIENAQCYEMAQNYSQVIASLMDARASVISNNLNVMMKNLNAIVIAIAIPSFLAGIGGMSEFSNIIGFNNWKFGYPTFILCMILLAVSTFFIIKKSERLWKK